MNFVKVDSIKFIHYYETRKNATHKPRIIEDNVQEIEVITEGKGRFKYEGRYYDIHPGDMFWFYPGDIVEGDADSTAPYKTVVFRFRIAEPAIKRPPFYSSWQNLDECVSFAKRARQRYMLDNYDNSYHECLYVRLYFEAFEYLERSESSQTDPLKRALKFIQANFSQDISVIDIANHADISVPHLHHLFRQVYNEAPMKKVVKLRLRKAESLLRTTNLSIKQISYECGFNSDNHFCYVFKKARRISPGSFRRA